MGTNCEETQSFLQLPETLAQLRTRLIDIGLSLINQLLLKGQFLGGLESCRPAVVPPARAVVLECGLPVCTCVPSSHRLQDAQASLQKVAGP